MGTWGPGVFDSDTSLEVVGEVAKLLKQMIVRDLKGMVKKSDQDVLERPVVAAVAILATLATKYPTARYSVTKGEVAQWKQEFLAWHEQWFVQGCSPDVWKPHKMHAKKEFDKLLKLADGDALHE